MATTTANNGSVAKLENVSQTSEASNHAVALREDLISTAVDFLENPRVQGSSNEVKKVFLKKKGLTNDEINAAFTRAKTGRVATVQPEPLQQQQSIVPYYGPWTKFRDFVNLIVFIGGAIYGIKFVWEKYIRRWIFIDDPSRKRKSTLEITLDIQEQMSKSMQTLNQSMEKMQEALESQKEFFREILETKTDVELKEIQSEIKSVKGLLLNSNRFPANPPISSPTIPSWQLLPKTSVQSVTSNSSQEMTKLASSTPDLIDKENDGEAKNSPKESKNEEQIINNKNEVAKEE